MNLYSLIAVAIFVSPFCLGIVAYIMVLNRKLNLTALETKVQELEQSLATKSLRLSATERDVQNLLKLVNTVTPKKVTF